MYRFNYKTHTQWGASEWAKARAFTHSTSYAFAFTISCIKSQQFSITTYANMSAKRASERVGMGARARVHVNAHKKIARHGVRRRYKQMLSGFKKKYLPENWSHQCS